MPKSPSQKTDQRVGFVHGHICPPLVSFRCILFNIIKIYLSLYYKEYRYKSNLLSVSK